MSITSCIVWLGILKLRNKRSQQELEATGQTGIHPCLWQWSIYSVQPNPLPIFDCLPTTRKLKEGKKERLCMREQKTHCMWNVNWNCLYSFVIHRARIVNNVISAVIVFIHYVQYLCIEILQWVWNVTVSLTKVLCVVCLFCRSWSGTGRLPH